METKLRKPKGSISIRKRILINYSSLFLLSVVIFELFLVYTVKYYYYSTVEGMLRSQAKYTSELFKSYLSDYSLEKAIFDDRDQFYKHNVAQVQILDNSGKVLLDNLGSDEIGKTISSNDVEAAKLGENRREVLKSTFTDSKIMTYSMPLQNRTEQVGIIRLIVSLEDIDKIIFKRNMIFIFLGMVIVALVYIISGMIADSIVKPINVLTTVAEKLADGKFETRASVTTNDEIGKLAKTINFITENINKKEQVKNDFISSISHELRTPLTSIKGWAVTLIDEAEEGSILMDGLNIIEKESDRLQKMVEELLDFSRYSSGRIEIKKSIVNLTEIVTNVKQELTPRAKNSNVNLILYYESENIIVEADKDRYKQVLINLLDNAIKFTDQDGVVGINLFEKDDYAVVEVIDTGVGIAPEEISSITGKFYKGKNSNSHIGLGLSITEEIVKLHNGSMIIESKLGEGTKITVKIPRGNIDEK